MAKQLFLIPKAKYENLLQPGESMTKQPTKMIPNISGNVDYPEDTDVLETTLKYAVPKNALRKAMGLWNYLKDRKGTLLDWNDDGEMSVHGQSITGSHMIDLIKHAVTPLSKKRPLGYSQFYSVLRGDAYPFGISNTARL